MDGGWMWVGGAETSPGGMLLCGFNVMFIDSMCPTLCARVCRRRSTMKDSIANNSTASISQARKAVEQLKMEACMDRIKVHVFLFYQTYSVSVRHEQNCWKLCVLPFCAAPRFLIDLQKKYTFAKCLIFTLTNQYECYLHVKLDKHLCVSNLQ